MKIRRLYLIVLLIASLTLLRSASLNAQSSIGGTWGNEPDKLITLWMLRGDLRLPVDSVRTGPEGQFVLTPKWNIPPGMYLLEDESSEPVRLILGGGDVKLEKNGTLRFLYSPDNIAWKDWVRVRTTFVQKQAALEALVEAYADDGKFRKAAIKELTKLRRDFIKTAANIKNRPGAAIAATFITADLPPMFPIGLSPSGKAESQKNYLLQMLGTADTMLIQSDMLPGRILDYLTLHQNRNMNRQQLEEAFVGAIDQLMKASASDNKRYLFYLEFLFEGFQRLGFYQLTDYLSSLPHFNAVTASIDELFEIERIIGPYHNILRGQDAPPIIGLDMHGNTFNLNDIQAEKILVVFWSEDCPHCTRLIPELKQIVDAQNSMYVVSIILGSDSPSLRDYIDKADVSGWTHLIEANFWQSELVEDFGVYGTPSMFLLDSEKRIIARPNTADELRNALGMP
ncbi:MAG TPA: TlpA disulfide reductase family protein [Bacteroidales bacterium]|nr:TlpA disulfide reductase family protein [Bacteroidales bacterium]